MPPPRLVGQARVIGAGAVATAPPAIPPATRPRVARGSRRCPPLRRDGPAPCESGPSARCGFAPGRPGWAGRTSRRSTSGLRRASCETMSSRTRRVAVAVNACRAAPEKSSLTCASCRYSGRNSCPHWLMQCASSTATKRTPQVRSRARNPSPPSPTRRSGVTYSSRQRPASRSAYTRRRSSGVIEAFRAPAVTPLATRPSTWSFISEMRGDTTRPTPPPGSTRAGIWKHSDLPPPVGSTTTLSRPCRFAAIASRCRGGTRDSPSTARGSRAGPTRRPPGLRDGRPRAESARVNGMQGSGRGGPRMGLVGYATTAADGRPPDERTFAKPPSHRL